MLSKNERHDAIWDACRANGVANLAFNTQVNFTKRLTRNYGSFYYKTKKIFLSELLFNSIPHVKQYECMVHLACHMIVRYKWERQQSCASLPLAHGKEWREAMRNARVPATTAYCYVPESEHPTQHVFGCNCGQDLRFHRALADTLIAHPFDCACCNKPMHLIGA